MLIKAKSHHHQSTIEDHDKRLSINHEENTKEKKPRNKFFQQLNIAASAVAAAR